MQVFHTIAEAAPTGRSAVACGFFDGLHIGHAAVIGRAVERARAEGLVSGVFTFTIHSGHPARKCDNCEIITETKKEHMLEKWGVELVLAPDFADFSGMEPEAFVDEVLVRRLGAAVVCCGDDFRFGRAAAGDVPMLKTLCAARGIAVDVVPEVLWGGERVSSTRIRGLLGEGDVETAGELLDRAFGYDFTVVHGKRLGRTIDSPTINQRFPADFVRLRHGVYASAARVDGKLRPAVTNIGLRPTVENATAVNSETYIIGFSGDLYGQAVEVRLLQFLRGEKKFPSVEALKEQIQADAAASRSVAERYIAEKNGK